MQRWFPKLPIQPYPSLEALPEILDSYALYCVVYNSTSPFVLKLIEEGKRRFPAKLKVLYFYPSKNIIREPYYEDARIDPRKTVRENLEAFSRELLGLSRPFSGNGIAPPKGHRHRRFLNRVAIHPTSSRPASNWPKEKYVKLALHLQKMGYHPVFIPGSQELAAWKDLESLGLSLAEFPDLDALAGYLYESGYFIGNDSGLGHMASCLQVPTVTLCRRAALAALWRPSFGPGAVLTPSRWIPNIRGLRLRDREWKRFISVARVQKAFTQLSQNGTIERTKL